VRHEIIACHVDMGFEWVKTDILRDYFESQDIPYVIANPNEQWNQEGQPLNCFWCSWNRRKALFRVAGEIGCNKIALGHHMDDITETVLLNLLFNGEIGTMRPYQEIFNGRITLIRPLAYVEEKDLARFSNQLDLPVIASRCPRAQTSKRRLVKGIITEVHKHNRNVKKNIFRSLQRIREEYLLGTEEKTEPGRFCDEA
jgi:tRNA 2-thiocytidine biosynthesis protein TtcA